MQESRRIPLLIAAVAAVALAACAPPRFASPPGPQAYRQGWHEGCADGYAVAGSPLYASKLEAAPPPAEADVWPEGRVPMCFVQPAAEDAWAREKVLDAAAAWEAALRLARQIARNAARAS